MRVFQDGVEVANKSLDVNLVATPSITLLTLASTTLAIGGPSTTYTATLQNPANSLQNVLLQGYVVQGAARQPAGGAQVTCGSSPGVMPPGTCTFSFSAAAANGGGTGTLAPGPAVFELNLMQGATTYDRKTVAVTLVSSVPRITSLLLSTTTLTIDGASADYTVEVQNPGFPKSNVILQGEIVENTTAGTVTRGAGGFSVDCGAGLGVLPTTGTGTCTMHLTVTASNSTGGTGTLLPGTASFVLHLLGTGVNPPTEIDSRTVAVELVGDDPCALALPKPVIEIWKRSVVGANIEYDLHVTNYTDFPDALFAASPDLPPCGANTSASRTWVDIYRADADNTSRIFGFCSFGQAADLNTLWFQVSQDNVPGYFVVELTDRRCGRSVRSDPVSTAFVQ
jgi:hypothetical protein